jgi:alpha-D-xyloside xylohydrolase
VFILTRSGFAGIQRYGTATWSGDTTSTWTGMTKQIAAGLGYCVSGTPYWTMDIGGYTMENKFSQNPTPANAEEWRELNARWFEFGAFCPFTRLHGELQYREPWAFGGDEHPAYKAIVKFDRLRYNLLPYIYSLAGAAAHDSGTMMRPFVMDFPQDTAAREIANEYMFGPAFLVAPVTAYQARSRSVYLPQSAGGWYDFWTGAPATGGQSLDAPAPYDAMPLFIRAGSIIPFGPELQYTGEKPEDPVTLRVYAGADGAFTHYEDDGKTYDCDHGVSARISFNWNDAARTLTIGDRQGSFPGMLTTRTFNVVLVDKNKPVGFSFTPTPDQTVNYQGKALTLTFK